MFKNIIDQDAFLEKVKVSQSLFDGYTYPTTKEEYWAIVDKYWIHLLDIVLQFGPEYIMHNGEYKKLAIAATSLKENRSPELDEYFQKTWAAAPDTGHIHAIPAWHILCDLSSESYLLSNEELFVVQKNNYNA